RLKAAIAALFGRATGRFALDDVDLALCGIALLAVGQLAGQRHVVERALATDEFPGLPRGFTRGRGLDGLGDHAFGNRRVLFEERAKPLVDDGLDDALDFGVAELGLRLTLELRLRDLHRDDRG